MCKNNGSGTFSWRPHWYDVTGMMGRDGNWRQLSPAKNLTWLPSFVARFLLGDQWSWPTISFPIHVLQCCSCNIIESSGISIFNVLYHTQVYFWYMFIQHLIHYIQPYLHTYIYTHKYNTYNTYIIHHICENSFLPSPERPREYAKWSFMGAQAGFQRVERGVELINKTVHVDWEREREIDR